MRGKIVTRHVFPPIPDRQFDWCAIHEGEEESRHAGWGKTEAEAIENLQCLDEEMAEYEEYENKKSRWFNPN